MADKPSPKKGKSFQRFKMYEKVGTTLKRKNPICPKCAEGTAMAVHKDRKTCGKCGYTEFQKR